MLRKLTTLLLDLVLPLACLGCGRDDVLVCNHCIAGIANSSRGIVRPSPYLDYAVIAAPYEPPLIRSMIKHFKFDGVTALAPALSQIMASALALHPVSPPPVLIPIPLHRKKELQRGYNQSLLLAQQLGERFDLTIDRGLLRIRNNRAQARLSRGKRLANVNGIFRYAGTEAPKDVLLIDDIATTFSTLNSAARELTLHGAERVTAAVVAKNTD